MEKIVALLNGDGTCGIALRREMEVGLNCLKEIGDVAVQTNTLQLVDAEYSFINPAISLLTQALTLITNRDKPVLWNTYQCYHKVKRSHRSTYA